MSTSFKELFWCIFGYVKMDCGCWNDVNKPTGFQCKHWKAKIQLELDKRQREEDIKRIIENKLKKRTIEYNEFI